MTDHRCGRYARSVGDDKMCARGGHAAHNSRSTMRRSDAVSFITTPDVVVRSSLARLRESTASLQGPALVALIYFLGAEAAFYIGTLSDQIFALFWPPNVVLFCALLLVPRQRWWLYIAAARCRIIGSIGRTGTSPMRSRTSRSVRSFSFGSPAARAGRDGYPLAGTS